MCTVLAPNGAHTHDWGVEISAGADWAPPLDGPDNLPGGILRSHHGAGVICNPGVQATGPINAAPVMIGECPELGGQDAKPQAPIAETIGAQPAWPTPVQRQVLLEPITVRTHILHRPVNAPEEGDIREE